MEEEEEEEDEEDEEEDDAAPALASRTAAEADFELELELELAAIVFGGSSLDRRRTLVGGSGSLSSHRCGLTCFLQEHETEK